MECPGHPYFLPTLWHWNFVNEKHASISSNLRTHLSLLHRLSTATAELIGAPGTLEVHAASSGKLIASMACRTFCKKIQIDRAINGKAYVCRGKTLPVHMYTVIQSTVQYFWINRFTCVPIPLSLRWAARPSSWASGSLSLFHCANCSQLMPWCWPSHYGEIIKKKGVSNKINKVDYFL